MSETIPDPEEYQPEEEEDEATGATTDPLADPPGSRGHKAKNPYEGTEANDDPGPSLTEQLEDNTPANDEQLEEAKRPYRSRYATNGGSDDLL